MNFSIKLFAAVLLVVAHQTIAMNNEETKPSLLNPSKSRLQAQSADGTWRMQAFGSREFLYKKNSAGNFEILGEMTKSETKALVSIGSNVSSKDRFLLRVTDNNHIDVIDTLRNKTRGLAKDDANLLHPISDELVAAHMSINAETIAVFDAQDKTILVANPLHENK